MAAAIVKIIAPVVLDQLIGGVGGHVRLNTINGAYKEAVREAKNTLGDNYAAIALGALDGANRACSPANLKTAELLGGCVEKGAKLLADYTLEPVVSDKAKKLTQDQAAPTQEVLTANEGVPPVNTEKKSPENNNASIVKAASGAAMVAGGLLASEALPGVMGNLPTLINLGIAGYNYMQNQNGTATSESKPALNAKPDQRKINEMIELLKDLNPNEIAEVQDMMKSLLVEMGPSYLDKGMNLAEKIVINATISTLSGALGNLAKLNVINNAYDASVAATGATARGIFGCMGDNVVGRAAQNTAEMVGRGIGHAVIAPQVATSAQVMNLSDQAKNFTTDGVSKILEAGADYAKTDTKADQPSLLGRIGKAAMLTLMGAGVMYLAPGAMGVAAATALAGEAWSAYTAPTTTEADKAIATLAGEAGAEVNGAKVSAAFIRLAALSNDEKAALADLAKLTQG